MERWQGKLLALCGCFILPFCCTILPHKLSGYVAKKGDVGKRVLGYLMCFGGGIFFGTYLLHMGPEVRKLLKDALLDPYKIEYPLVDLFVGCGFLLVLFAEKFVLRWNKGRTERRAERKRLEAERFQFNSICYFYLPWGVWHSMEWRIMLKLNKRWKVILTYVNTK